MDSKLHCYLSLMTLVFQITEGERLNDHISYYEPLSLSASSFKSPFPDELTTRFSFSAHGRFFELHLRTHPTLFHPDFHLLIVGKEGARKKYMNTRHIVTGYIKGENASLVHGLISDDRSFEGIIHSTKETYHIDPLSHHPLATKHPHLTTAHNRVIYKSSDVDYDQAFSRCQSGNSSRLRLIQESAGMPTVAHTNSEGTNIRDTLRKKRQSDKFDTCTIQIVAEKLFYTNVGGSLEKNTLDEMALHIMNADKIYSETTFEGNNGPILGSRLSIHSSVIYTDDANNPLSGEYSVEELLEAFSEGNFDEVCLGHLFTYRDFQGTIGLAYLGDPNGQLSGGICQKRTRTSIGEVNLNTGYTSLLNFGRRLSRAVSLITVAHEIGHNYGSPHDPPGECFDNKYIMYPYASSDNRDQFSDCSRDSMGRTIEVRGSCFVEYPSGAQCGNGIIEPGEACDCGETDQVACTEKDPCCLVNCTLIPGANCSSFASTCCNNETCQPLNDPSFLCLKGDTDGGCQRDTFCAMDKPECPNPMIEEDGRSCNNGTNTCKDGACTGSPCLLFDGQPKPCYCDTEEELCHVCCEFDGTCTSTFQRDRGLYVLPNYPCNNFTGYCTEEKLRDILLNFSSIWNWVKGNWYWVLVGSVAIAILIVLLQVTYRRKKLSTPEEDQQPRRGNLRWGRRRRRKFRSHEVGEERAVEQSGLIT